MATNLGLIRRTPWIYTIGLWLCLAMSVGYFVACLAKSADRLAPSKYVWTEFINIGTGWSDGTIFLIGLLNANFAFVGIDGAVHLAEDCRNAAQCVPRALLTTVLLGFGVGFPFLVVMFYCVYDSDLVISSAAPIFEIWRQGTKSNVGATIMVSILIASAYPALVAGLQTASRLTWSLARDDALIGSHALGRIHPGLEVPVNAVLASTFVIFLLGFLLFASNLAFIAISANAIILMHLAIAIPASLKLWSGRDPRFLPEKGPFGKTWNLGAIGWVCDAVAAAWGPFVLIIYCFPSTRPTNVNSANYAPVVVGAIGLFCIVNWFVHATKNYKGPKINLENLKDL